MANYDRPRIVVVGAGAMGSLIGGMLAEGGLDVTLLDIDEEHVARINADGLNLVGVGGDRKIRLTATSDPAEAGRADVVLVQCKAPLTREAVARARDAIFGPDSVAISFQNGLGNEEIIGEVVGIENVLGGLTAQGATKEAPGRVRNFGDLPTYVGELDGGLSNRAVAIAEAFTAAGLDTHASADIRRDMWKKLLANVWLSCASGATNLNARQIMAIPELAEVCFGALDEAATVARASGVDLSEAETRETIEKIQAAGGTGDAKSSLCIDLLNKRPSEVDQINGAIARMGRELGVATPINATMVAIVKGLQSHYL